ncbi:hypothetical protein E3O25_08825 [Cryobacterium sp. TMT1-3]|uniref:Uncharacterized protein n=1 Tax=Cryobacterium luteum TaxID=1424661 RepID=A0A1H8JY92_9MICO|nr:MULTISPECIES: hypothetical protein [Cryobacterium]TFB81981.1 hypothetical protein E3O10_17950 [Cryobacterium luteum]TFC28240.1 hypothetical protein E3O25_08825 [Cryobacterium sp. TMT1-3]SEN85178.1 hypothetical protein SAMN05216281_11648 [Cryobacterium luteum]
MKTPRPTRTRRRFWVDPRFVIGLVLVAASIAGVGMIVAGSDRTTAVYTARHTLTVGDHLKTADVTLTRVQLGGATDLYLVPSADLKGGLLVTQTILAGELVARSAVGDSSGSDVTSVVVDIPGGLAGSISAGSVVDIWSARATGPSEYAPPTILVGQAVVVRIVEPTGIIAASSGQSVEMLVPKATVGAVLEAVMNGDALAIVPVNTPAGA